MHDNAQGPVDPAVGPKRRSAELTSARPSDAALLGRVSRGERAAFEAVYDRYVAPVHGLVLAVVGDAERAAAVVAELFVDLWRSPSDVTTTPGSAPSPFSTTILAAAHRRAVQAVRAHRQGPAVGEVVERRLSPPAARVLEDIGDPDAITAVGLAYFDARTVREIAARMEVPRRKVASLLNRGLEGLGRNSRAR